jgi:hypothetical protein
MLANHPNILGRGPTASSLGIGDVDGPASSTDNALVRFDGMTGKIIQNSNVTLADSGTAFVFSAEGGITAGGANSNITLTPGGPGLIVGSRPIQLPNTLGYRILSSGAVSVPLLTLNADDSLSVGSSTTIGAIRFFAGAAESVRFTTAGTSLFGTTTDSSNGRIQLATHTTSAGGIAWGARAAEVIYRTANDTLRTDATWQIGRFTQAITDTRSGAGAVSVTTDTTKLTSTGVGEAITLADGADGQIKRMVHDVDGGTMVLTPTTKTGFSTVTFTNAGDTVTLQFVTTRGWMVMGSYGVTVAP